MNTILPTLLADTTIIPLTPLNTLWLVVLTIITTLAITLLAQAISREHQRVAARLNGQNPSPNTENPLSPSRPQIIVNVPSDFKPIEPLPGDTSVEGQRAVLFYSVFKEALCKMNPNQTVASEDEVDTAANVAERAVEACYREGKGP